MFWFEEDNSNWPYRKSFYKVKQLLYSGRSAYQQIDVCDLEFFGKALFLDRALQFTEFDEALYHEMFVHPAAGVLKPSRVCILGGGDGGVCREALKHPSVKEIKLCDIDKAVVEVCSAHFPNLASSLNDPKVEVAFADARDFIKEFNQYFDLIFVDLTDLSDCSQHLYSKAFLSDIKKALRPDGAVVMQTSGIYFSKDESFNFRTLSAMFNDLFRFVSTSSTLVPSFSDGDNSFTYASDVYNFKKLDFVNLDGYHLKFYTPAFAKGSFCLPLVFEQ